MADNFGLKIGVDGEKEFKNALKDINQSFKVLGSEMQLMTSHFDKNDKSVEALTARNKALNVGIDAQKEKIATLQTALDNASESFGENDRRTQNWVVQLNKAQSGLNSMQLELDSNTDAISSRDEKTIAAIESEKRFKDSLQDINQTFRVLGSEMDLVASQFDKNDSSVEALTARNVILNKEIDTQKEKITTLKEALDHSSESFGENDKRTQDWQIELNKAQAELNGMERELSKNEDALSDVGSEMDDVADSADDMGEEIDDAADSADKGSGKFEKFGSVLKGIGVALGAVAVAAGAAALAITKEVIAAYGDYEQFVGGVDTLFKDSSRTVQDYAANAYKTAGLTANQYMETVTGFSASLIQSLDGDTLKAASVADMAITDMADNANKLGTNISSIQDAYQGFAKQNFTMLDNLKIGYGGTKSEMERLLADAEKISGIKYDISSFSDMAEAIHIIQTEMDITGTTALEATETITGSISSMQSAIGNLMVGLGDADADVEMLIGNIIESFKDVVKNIVPVIENIVESLPAVLDGVIVAIDELLPTLLSTVISLFTQVLETLLTLIPELIPMAVDAIMTIAAALIENLPLLVEAAVQLISALVTGFGQALPTLIPAAMEAIVTIVKGLVDNLPMILDAALELILGLTKGLLDALPVLIESLPEIIDGIVTFLLDAIPQIIEAGIELLTSLIEALPTIIDTIVTAIPQIIENLIDAVINSIPLIIQAGIDLLTSLIAALPQIINSLVPAIPRIVTALVNTIINNIDKIISAGVTLFVSLIKNLPTIITEIAKAVPQIISGMVREFGNQMHRITEIGGNIVKGLWNGIQQLKDWLWNKVSGWISGIWNGITDFFGIRSPSLQMAWVGEMLVKGLAGSIDDNGDDAVKAAERMSQDIDDVLHDLADEMQTALPTEFNLDASINGITDTPLAAGGLSLTLNIDKFNNYSNDDIRELTNEIMITAEEFATRRSVAFA